MGPDKQWAEVPEIARRIGRSEWTVRDLARKGLIPHHRLTPMGRLLFDLDEIDAWLESRHVDPDKQPAAS